MILVQKMIYTSENDLGTYQIGLIKAYKRLQLQTYFTLINESH